MLPNHWAYPHRNHPSVSIETSNPHSFHVCASESSTLYPTSVSEIGMPTEGDHVIFLHISSCEEETGWTIGVMCNDLTLIFMISRFMGCMASRTGCGVLTRETRILLMTYAAIINVSS